MVRGLALLRAPESSGKPDKQVFAINWVGQAFDNVKGRNPFSRLRLSSPRTICRRPPKSIPKWPGGHFQQMRQAVTKFGKRPKLPLAARIRLVYVPRHLRPVCQKYRGEVPEWLNGAVSKTVERASVPGVRIPLSPPAPFPLSAI